MANVTIVHSSRWTSSVSISSGSTLAATSSIVATSTEEMLTVAAHAFDAVVSSTVNCRSRRLSSYMRCSRWLAAQASVSLGGIAVADLPADAPRMELGESPASAAPSPTMPKLSRPTLSRMERIELAIDSLQNYELLEPIPVLVESLGDKVFVAEAPDLNVSTTGNSVGAAFLLLKEQILTAYEGSRGKKGSDADRARQLAVFEKYIGKPRRHWF